MKEFIEKLIGRLEEEKDTAYNTYMCLEMKVDLGRAFGVERAIEIVNLLAEEYKPNTNDAWKIIYNKVCNLEKEYATKGNMASVNDCIRLENLLQYFKEELHCSEEHEHFRAMTNADKIRAMTDAELAEFASLYVGCGYCDAGTISGDCSAHCKENLLKWLQSEAE